MTADVEEVEVVVAHQARITLRVGDVFVKLDADRSRLDVEVEAMTMPPVPTPEILWRKPHELALAALPGTALGRLGQPSPSSPAAWAAAGAAVRTLHDAPLPHGAVGNSTGSHHSSTASASGSSPTRSFLPTWSPTTGGSPRGAQAVDAGVHARRPAGLPHLRRR
jgi:hypothetical protein